MNPNKPHIPKAANSTTDVRAVLQTRGATHGKWTHNASVAANLKAAVYDELDPARLPKNKELVASIMVGLDYITQKLARIAAGDATEIDHWVDIAGYATLVADSIREAETHEYFNGGSDVNR